MKRRNFLAAAGAAGVGAFGLSARRSEPLAVRIWVTERAADHDGLRERIEGYLGRALEAATGPVRLSFGGTVDVSTENAYVLLVSTEWPRLLFDGLAGGGAGPVTGVNLLVTDGDMRRAPTGAGVRHVAAVGGASTLAALPPVEETPTEVEYANRWRVAQVLLHESGHALGLSHDHGTIRMTTRGPVVSPMVSSYAWAPEHVQEAQFDYAFDACGSPYPTVDPAEARLSLEFSACAGRTLPE